LVEADFTSGLAFDRAAWRDCAVFDMAATEADRVAFLALEERVVRFDMINKKDTKKFTR
jgi:hypothetical protein